MPKVSSGLLMFRRSRGEVEFLLVHPGGPLWGHKDEGFWSIPKGEVEAGEDLLDAAKREFEEETSLHPEGPYMELVPVKTKSGKTIHAWAFEGDCDTAAVRSNLFTMEWPPHSGQQAQFPEIDRAEFFRLGQGRIKIGPGQVPLLEELAKKLEKRGSTS